MCFGIPKTSTIYSDFYIDLFKLPPVTRMFCFRVWRVGWLSSAFFCSMRHFLIVCVVWIFVSIACVYIGGRWRGGIYQNWNCLLFQLSAAQVVTCGTLEGDSSPLALDLWGIGRWSVWCLTWVVMSMLIA